MTDTDDGTTQPIVEYHAERLEWVRASFLRDLTNRVEEAEARAVQAEATAALLLTALSNCQNRLDALIQAAVAEVEGDADGTDRLEKLLWALLVNNQLPDQFKM